MQGCPSFAQVMKQRREDEQSFIPPRPKTGCLLCRFVWHLQNYAHAHVGEQSLAGAPCKLRTPAAALPMRKCAKRPQASLIRPSAKSIANGMLRRLARVGLLSASSAKQPRRHKWHARLQRLPLRAQLVNRWAFLPIQWKVQSAAVAAVLFLSSSAVALAADSAAVASLAEASSAVAAAAEPL